MANEVVYLRSARATHCLFLAFSLSGATGCSNAGRVEDLTGKTDLEIAALIGEPTKIRCGSTAEKESASLSKLRRQAGEAPPDAFCTWLFSDGYVAFDSGGKVIEYTPGIRHCEVRFPRGWAKQRVQQALGSPTHVGVICQNGARAVHENWSYADGSVGFDKDGHVVEQYGRLVKSSGPLTPIPTLPANWDKLRPDMKGDDVRAVLGEPIKREKHIYDKEKISFEGTYNYTEGSVGFGPDGRVTYWSYPAREGE